MCKWRSLALIVLTIVITPNIVFSQVVKSLEQTSDYLTITRISSPIKLDGISNEKAWEGIDPLPVVMQKPVFGGEPSERTEILIGYDSDYLYVAGRMYDSSPEEIHMTTMKRDDFSESSDSFGIVLDTFNDNENALMFCTTPSGNRVDFSVYGDLLARSGGANSSWNTFWDVETVVNNEGWFLEMRIPMSSLRFQDSGDGVVMGMTVFRRIARTNEWIMYPAIPEEWGDSSYAKPSKAKDVLFTGIKSHKPLYLTPYILGGLGQTNNLNKAGTGYSRDDDYAREAGVDLKYSLTSNMTVDLTVNTDFAQVEADNQQVNLTRYSLFYPEKRLFFLERESNFNFDFYSSNKLFHSRRIGIHNGKQVPILGGARVYGRVGKWDIGFLSMQTDKSEDLPSENFGVLRLKRQVLNPYSYLGGMVTSRMGNTGAYNTAYGLDGNIRVFGDDILKFNWAQTFENNTNNDLTDLDKSKIRIHWERYRYVGWAYGLNYSRSGEDYNPGLGYEKWCDSTSYVHFLRYGWQGKKESIWFHNEVYEDVFLHYWNTDASVKTFNASAGWGGRTKSNYSCYLRMTRNYEDVRDVMHFSETCEVPVGTYEFIDLSGSFHTPGGRLNSLSLWLNGGSFYDGHKISPGASFRRSVSSNLEISYGYNYNKVDFSKRSQDFTSHISNLRLQAMLSVKYSVNAFVQYSSASDQVISNVRFRYNPREGSDLYLVYDEAFNMDRERIEPVLPITKNRTVLLKYSYTFDILGR